MEGDSYANVYKTGHNPVQSIGPQMIQVNKYFTL